MLEKAKKNELNHFDVNMAGFNDTTKFVVSIMKVRGTLSPLFCGIPSGVKLT